jgi:hypothetical protein
MITDSMIFLKPFITKIFFKYTQNVFEDIPKSPNYSNNVVRKKNLGRSEFSKKRGGGSGKVWSWSQIQWVFYPFPCSEAMMFWISGGKGSPTDWLNEWRNYQAVCRTVPATLGLLISCLTAQIGLEGLFWVKMGWTMSENKGASEQTSLGPFL